MSTSAQVTYEIRDGVRRAKALELNGETMIRAKVQQPDGSLGPVIIVPISCLRSPKPVIDMTTSAKTTRFFNVWNAVKAGNSSQLPPIEIRPGSRGVLVRDVGWQY